MTNTQDANIEEQLTEITLINPTTKEQFSVPIQVLSPNRLGRLMEIKTKHPDQTEHIEFMFDMVEADPSLATVSSLLVGTEAENDNAKRLLGNYVNGESNKEKTRSLLIRLFLKETQAESLASKSTAARLYIEAMTDEKDYPKGVKLNDAFWTFQNAKAVLKYGKFFRQAIADCLSEN